MNEIDEKILEHNHGNLLSFLNILDIPDGRSRPRSIPLGFLRLLHHDLDLHGALPSGLLVVVVDVTDLLHGVDCSKDALTVCLYRRVPPAGL